VSSPTVLPSPLASASPPKPRALAALNSIADSPPPPLGRPAQNQIGQDVALGHRRIGEQGQSRPLQRALDLGADRGVTAAAAAEFASYPYIQSRIVEWAVAEQYPPSLNIDLGAVNLVRTATISALPLPRGASPGVCITSRLPLSLPLKAGVTTCTSSPRITRTWAWIAGPLAWALVLPSRSLTIVRSSEDAIGLGPSPPTPPGFKYACGIMTCPSTRTSPE
jgi:hypothetical protein